VSGAVLVHTGQQAARYDVVHAAAAAAGETAAAHYESMVVIHQRQCPRYGVIRRASVHCNNASIRNISIKRCSRPDGRTDG